MKIFIYKPDREMFKFSSIYSLKPPNARDIILRLHVQYVDKKTKTNYLLRPRK